MEYHGAQRIELTHDVLTGVVREHRDRRRAEEEKAMLAEAAEQAHEREQAAQALAAAEQRAKVEAQQHARALIKRTRVLYTVLALVVIVVFAFAKAFNAQREADARLRDARDANVERLYANSLPMLTGMSSLGSDEVRECRCC